MMHKKFFCFLLKWVIPLLFVYVVLWLVICLSVVAYTLLWGGGVEVLRLAIAKCISLLQ